MNAVASVSASVPVPVLRRVPSPNTGAAITFVYAPVSHSRLPSACGSWSAMVDAELADAAKVPPRRRAS